MFLIIKGICEQALAKFRLLESGSLAVLIPHCEFPKHEKNRSAKFQRR